MHSTTLPSLQTGWAYTLSGKPVAYTMQPNEPGTVELIEFDSWWRALHYAVIFAEVYPRCEFVGGPSND
jgi:hypothetical protein